MFRTLGLCISAVGIHELQYCLMKGHSILSRLVSVDGPPHSLISLQFDDLFEAWAIRSTFVPLIALVFVEVALQLHSITPHQ